MAHPSARGSIAGRALFCILAATALLGAGCFVHHHQGAPGHEVRAARHAGHGPPAHAPAHGYRKKHPVDRVELVFDVEVGVYAVVGRSGVYWDGDRYIEWRDGHWRVSARLDRGWASISYEGVPRALRARHPKHAHEVKAVKPGLHGHGHGRGGGHPAKHGY